MLSLRHLQTPLSHLFSALGAVTGWAGLSHPGLNRTFRSPEGTGVSVAAGASLGLGGKAAVSQCRMESCGRHKCVQREKSSAVLSPSMIYILCVSSVLFHTWVTVEFLLLIRPPHYLVKPWPASHLLFALSLPEFAPRFDTSVHRGCSSLCSLKHLEHF